MAVGIGALQTLPEGIPYRSVPDETVLTTVANGLPFLATFIPADLHLYKHVGDHQLRVIAEAKPLVRPSFYRRSHLDCLIPLNRYPIFTEVWASGRPGEGMNGSLLNGLPIQQMVYPVLNTENQPIGLLHVERNLHEEMRQGPKQGLYRGLVQEVVDTLLTSALGETRYVPAIEPGNAIMILDEHGIIAHETYSAVNLARVLGITDVLEGNRFDDLFAQGDWRVIEANRLYSEQELLVGDSIIQIRAIPLKTYTIVILNDVTKLRHKEQEIEVKSAIIREVHHRVKNNLQAMAGLLRMQQRRSRSPEVQAILAESINRVNSIALVHEYLSQQDVEVVNLAELAQNILSAALQCVDNPDVHIRSRVIAHQPIYYPSSQATSVALVLNELVSNAMKHAFKGREKGEVSVILAKTSHGLEMAVQDDGVGLPPNFDPIKQANLGWRIIMTLVKEDLHGSLSLSSDEKGATIRVTVPEGEKS